MTLEVSDAVPETYDTGTPPRSLSSALSLPDPHDRLCDAGGSHRISA
ncbi:hypothetical protein ACIOHS_46790 [Streptomyces sp. NPDC088253]